MIVTMIHCSKEETEALLAKPVRDRLRRADAR